MFKKSSALGECFKRAVCGELSSRALHANVGGSVLKLHCKLKHLTYVPYKKKHNVMSTRPRLDVENLY